MIRTKQLTGLLTSRSRSLAFALSIIIIYAFFSVMIYSSNMDGNYSIERTWFPMLGDIEPQAIKVSPKFHIKYQSNGFDRVRPNRIKKGVRYLREVKAEHLIERFRQIGNDVEKIPLYIDEAYEFNLKQYQECRGKFQNFITNNNPRNIMVEVIAIPKIINNQWAGGYALSNAIDVKCTIVVVNGLLDNPSTSDLREFKDYVRWEIGNLLAFRFGVKPKKLDEEWGDFIPCSRRQP